jgi:heme a synthase
MEKRRAFYKLSLATLLAVYFLILVGGIVRSTGSGMGCPDWPKCFGRWVPPTSIEELPPNYKEVYSQYREKKNVRFARYLRVVGFGETADKILTDKSVLEEADFNATKTIIEYVNRVIGVIIGFLIFAVFVSSLKFRKTDRKLTVIALSTFLLVGFQGWIGSFVVSTNLTPWTITVHMFLALLIVALLIYLMEQVNESAPVVKSPTSLWLIIACMIVLLVQVLLGTQVREAIDSVATIAVREQWITEIQADLYIHRSFSWIVLILHTVLTWNLMKTTGSKTFAVALILLILSTILTGAGMAYFNVPPFLQPIHLLLATVTFGMQFLVFLKLNRNVKPIVATR